MTDLYFNIEAIINYPKVLVDKEKFEATLYFKKSDFDEKLKPAFERAHKEFKKSACTLKKIKETNESVSKILPPEYVFQHSINGKLDFLKSIDLYRKPFPLAELKSGDKVYIKGVLRQTENPNVRTQKYITMYINLIAKVEDQPYQLFNEEEKNKEFYDALDSYKVHFNQEPESAQPDLEEEETRLAWE